MGQDIVRRFAHYMARAIAETIIRAVLARFSHQGQTSRSLEGGDSSPLSLAATRRGQSPSADESALEEAGASSRTPKFASDRAPRRLGGGSDEVRVLCAPQRLFDSAQTRHGGDFRKSRRGGLNGIHLRYSSSWATK